MNLQKIVDVIENVLVTFVSVIGVSVYFVAAVSLGLFFAAINVVVIFWILKFIINLF